MQCQTESSECPRGELRILHDTHILGLSVNSNSYQTQSQLPRGKLTSRKRLVVHRVELRFMRLSHTMI